MKVSQIAAAIEQVAPLDVQEGFDNSGLLVGDPDAEVGQALLCVDITPEVVAEAVETGAGMIIAHHPVIFHPLKRLTGTTYIERAVPQAIKHNIALYAAHTNLDNVREGLSFRLGEMFGLTQMDFLLPSADKPGTGTGVAGTLPQAVDVVEFLKTVKQKLGLKVVRHSTPTQATVRKVAVCSGSGASFLAAAKASGADIYLAGDFKYNDFLNADTAMIIADIGHFESEYCAKEIIFGIIAKNFSNFVARFSKVERNPVNYLT